MFNPSTGRYFPSKYLFGTCSKNFLIEHSIATLFVSVCSQEMGDLKKNIFFGDAAVIVIGLGGAKNGSKRGAWHRNWAFS